MAGQEGGEGRRAGEGRVDLKKERSLAEGTKGLIEAEPRRGGPASGPAVSS
jgi:hypothetical protein